MKRDLGRFSGALIAVVLFFGSTDAGEVEYYRGKTVRIVVGLSAGGGFDIYARTMARHMGKHVPGNPAFIVDNMPGAGSMISANHVYKVAKPDGLTLGHFVGSLFMQQLLGRPGAEFEATRFEFVGSPIPEKTACALTMASGITSMENWQAAKSPVKLGGTGSGPHRRRAENPASRHRSADSIGARLQRYGRYSLGGRERRVGRRLLELG